MGISCDIIVSKDDYIALEKEEVSAIRKALFPYAQKKLDEISSCENFPAIGSMCVPATVRIKDENHDVMLYGYRLFVPMEDCRVYSNYLVDTTAIKDIKFENPSIYITPCMYSYYAYSSDSSYVALFKGDCASQRLEQLQTTQTEYGIGNVYGVCYVGVHSYRVRHN